MRLGRLALAAGAAAVVMGAASAQAFTYDNRTNQTPSGAARYADPDDALTPTAPDSKDSGSKSGFSFHFSGGPQGNAPQGFDERFVPSANPAFASPYNSPNNMDYAFGNRRW